LELTLTGRSRIVNVSGKGAGVRREENLVPKLIRAIGCEALRDASRLAPDAWLRR
jgi:hypothetical protein